MFSILMLVLDNFILSLGFCSQDNYLLRDRKGYESFHSMIDPTAIIFNWIFIQIKRRADMTSWLIELSFSNRPFSPVRAKVECCELHKLFSHQSQTAQASGSYPQALWVATHGQQVASLGFFSPSAEV